jgi:hypothetical protein
MGRPGGISRLRDRQRPATKKHSRGRITRPRLA